MITTPTAFVLGAGASKDFGFPTGWELLKKLVTEFGSNSTNRTRLIQWMRVSELDIDGFIRALDQSGENSVDAFLEKRQKFMAIGKAMMAIILIGLENTGSLFHGSASDNWMRYLLTRMQVKQFGDFTKNQVAFITFNYDRSLEHFLCTALSNSFDKSESEAAATISQIPIIHLHGQLGYLPWQQQENSRGYDATVNQNLVEMCVREIKIVHEGIDDRKEKFNEAKDILNKADRAYFLGVGFNNVNLDRLGVLNLRNNKAWSTCVGLTPMEFTEFQKKFGPKLSLRQNYNCIRLLNDFVDWT